MIESIFVNEFEFDKPDIHEIDYLLDDIMKGCRNNYFHTFEYTLVYDNKFTNIINNEEVNFTITHRSMEFKTEFYDLNKKNKNARRNGFVFNQVKKLTIKIYSNLSNIYIYIYIYTLLSKISCTNDAPKIFRIQSQNREYEKIHCNDLYNPFQFACRKWYLDNQSS